MNKNLNIADSCIKNVKVFNSYFKCFNEADVYIKDGKFLYIDEKKQNEIECHEFIDGQGRYMIPGLIDIHMHIESTLVTSEAFCRYTVRNGLTTIVSEPHEIANVCGVEGIRAMMKSGEKAPYDCYFAIPSNVPIMSEEFETAGAVITTEDMLELKNEKMIRCLGEVMNFREIIHENDSEVAGFIEQVHESEPDYILEGHCPALVDSDLAKFLYLGIGSDHCEHNIEEFRQRFANGMFVQIQDSTLRQEIIDLIIENNLYEYFSFVTDDTFPDLLCERGHLAYLVRKAIGMGMKPEWAIYCATYTPARRMNFTDRGVIAPGKLADFVLTDSPEKLTILNTYKRGKCVFDINDPQDEREDYTYGPEFENSLKLKPLTTEQIKVKVEGPDRTVKVRVMELFPQSNMTKEKLVEMQVVDNVLQWQDSGCALTMSVERHGKNGSIGYGFSYGCCLKEGAAATSYSHDSHNITLMGCNEEDMLLAVNRLIEIQGGFVVTNNGKVQAEMRLPIAGLLSNKSVEKTAEEFTYLRKAFENQGYQHYNTVMNFCLLSLTCINSLRVTNRGMMDTVNLQMVPLIMEER
ncbi:MAG: adenine deaminase [Erysipelotrichaceae bacterium]|nr:adenine deaminase [Erysipelotrichaceae bacterium]